MVGFLLPQKRPWIDWNAKDSSFKMKMRTCRPTSGTHVTNGVPDFYGLTFENKDPI